MNTATGSIARGNMARFGAPSDDTMRAENPNVSGMEQ
jgi:hypothetical protein